MDCLPRGKNRISRLLINALLIALLSQDCHANLPPYFTDDLNNHVIPENTPVGTPIYTLRAVDPEKSELRFGIMGTDKLVVDEKTGVVTIAKPIDREVADQLKVTVTVEDVVGDGLSENNIVNVKAKLIVSDINDNAVQFLNQSGYESLEVIENTQVGSKILSINLKDPDLTGLELSLKCSAMPQSPEACDVFPITIHEATSGHLKAEMKLGQKLNYNKRSLYQLILTATDGEHISKAGVLIRIKDVQNTAPVFVGAMSGRVMEDAVVGSLVMVIEAKDGDAGKPRDVRLTLLTNPGDSFHLDSTSGHLTTTRPLDREMFGSLLHLSVKAQELPRSDEPLTSLDDIDILQTIANVSVLIDDVNDFPPTFNRREFFTVLMENTPAGTPLPDLDIYVTDKDSGTFADFSLKIEGHLSEFFDIEPKFASGSARPTIRLKKSFDYENPNERKFIILVLAQNMEEPELYSTLSVHLSITDENDNRPIFNQDVYTLSVPELAKPGTKVGSITATDLDSKGFGTEGLIYQLVGAGNKKFSVNPKTGDISVAECPSIGNNSTVTTSNCLDYEVQKTYDLLYMASDNYKMDGFIHSIVPLKIHLLDENDNPPSLPRQFRRTILEHTRQFEPRFFIRADDVDKTAILSYKMTELSGNASTLFSLDETTAELYIKSPALPPGNYSLLVEASDGLYKATTSVLILVIDINNNVPVFKEPMQRIFHLPEDAPIGTVLTTLIAFDKDFNANGEVRYNIESGSHGFFGINEDSGEIAMLNEVDFYKRAEFDLLVSARDSGTPPLRTLTTLNVKVMKVYSPLPKINPIVQRAQISESAKIGEVVSKILLEDSHGNGNVSFEDLELKFEFVEPIEIRNSDNKAVTDFSSLPDWFDINDNGEVVVTTDIVRAMAIAMNLTVMLTSEKARPGAVSLGTLMLTVFEVNSLPPRIEDVEIETYEELPPGMAILTLSADDPDGGQISDYFVGVGSEFVSVDNKTGEIKVAGRLDYETRPVYNITIIAVDSGVPPRSSTGTVIINLMNINDNPPEFSETPYQAEVFEHASEGTVVTSVLATDPDGDVISYEFEPGEYTAAFRVDRLGQVTVTKEGSSILDSETLPSPFINLGIRAKDSENVGYGTLIVKVLDTNDVWPKIEQKNYHVSVHAPVRAAQELLKITAHGGDQEDTDEIRFKIQSGNDQGLFEIDSKGILSAAKAYEETGEFRLVVEVTDRKSNRTGLDHYDRTGIFIQIHPGNFRKPEFKFPNRVNSTLPAVESNSAESALFSEENYTKVLGQLIAFDTDEGEAGQIQYFFKDGENLVTETEQFRVDTDSGTIHQIKPLDREKMNRYNLVVVAKDGGIPVSAQTSQMLNIEVEDLDDHSAVFIEKHYNFSVNENSLENTFIGQVKAVDEDEGRNAQVFYFLVAKEENRHYIHNDLRVDIKSGAILTNAMLDHERINLYEFFIRASDSPMANKSMEVMKMVHAREDPSMCFVQIVVKDLNDNSPSFLKKQYYAGINSDAEPGREILTFESTDVDPSSQDFIQYSLLGANLILDDFKPGGSVVPSPFRVDTNTGRLTISPTAMRQFAGGTNRFMVKVGVKETIPPYHQDTTQVKVWVVEKTQEAILTIKTPPTEMLKDELIDLLANITGRLVLVNKVTPHVAHDLSVNKQWSDVFVTAVDKQTSQIIPVGQFLQALDLGHDRLHRKGVPIELYSAVPAMGSTDRDTFFNNRESFDTAFAGLVALVALLCMGIASILAICCCLNRMYAIKKSEKGSMLSVMKYPLHPGGSIPGTPAITRNILSQKQPEMIEDLATDNPLWIDHKIKSYEEQELTMQVASDLDNSNGTDDGMSMDMDEPRTLSLTRQQSPQFSHAYATLHPHPPEYDNILDDTIAIHL